MSRKITFAILICTQLSACTGAPRLPESLQKYVAVGMSSDEVNEIMGSPMAVITDANHNKSWAYHDLKSDIRLARGQNRLSSMLATGHFAYATDEQMRMSRPPKFVVYFDDENRVERYAYLVKAARATSETVAMQARLPDREHVSL